MFTFKDKAPPTEQTHVLLSVIAVLLFYPLILPTEQTNVLLSVIAVLLLYPLMFEPKQ